MKKLFLLLLIIPIILFACGKKSSETIEPTTPSAPALSLKDSGFYFITLTWQDIDGADSYNIYRFYWDDGEYDKIGSTSDTSYTDTDVEKGKFYWYKISAVSRDEESDLSQSFQAHTWWWDTVDVDSLATRGYYPSIDVSNDKIYIAYFDTSARDLKLATFDKEWSTEIVDSSGSVGYYPSLTVNDSKIYISYYDATNQTIKLAVKDQNGWNISTIDDGYYYSSIQVNDNIYIAYYKDHNLYYATDQDGWTPHLIDDSADVGQYVKIKIENDKIYIAYYDNTHHDLKLAIYDGSWNIQTLDEVGDAGRYCDLAVEDSIVYVAYYFNSDLKLIYNKDGYWQDEILDTGGMTGYWPSINVENGIIRVAFYNSTYQTLNYISNRLGEWDKDKIDDEGSYLSMMVVNGIAYIAYYKNTDLYFAKLEK